MRVKREVFGPEWCFRWVVRWEQDSKPRRYLAQSWGEAIAFACAQLRAMKEPTL